MRGQQYQERAAPSSSGGDRRRRPSIPDRRPTVRRVDVQFPACERLFGYHATEVIGEKRQNAHAGNRFAASMTTMSKTSRGPVSRRSSVSAGRVVGRRKDGTNLPDGPVGWRGKNRTTARSSWASSTTLTEAQTDGTGAARSRGAPCRAVVDNPRSTA